MLIAAIQSDFGGVKIGTVNIPKHRLRNGDHNRITVGAIGGRVSLGVGDKSGKTAAAANFHGKIKERQTLINIGLPQPNAVVGNVLGGDSTITFIIGGSLGLDEEIKRKAKFKLSFSKKTVPHQLMRLILTEQIYRGFKINANERYHK